MSRPPGVIRVAYVITRAANVVSPIPNLDRDGAWITTIVWPATVVRSVPRIRGVIPLTTYRANSGTE
jgi:hypothetical protein